MSSFPGAVKAMDGRRFLPWDEIDAAALVRKPVGIVATGAAVDMPVTLPSRGAWIGVRLGSRASTGATLQLWRRLTSGYTELEIAIVSDLAARWFLDDRPVDAGLATRAVRSGPSRSSASGADRGADPRPAPARRRSDGRQRRRIRFCFRDRAHLRRPAERRVVLRDLRAQHIQELPLAGAAWPPPPLSAFCRLRAAQEHPQQIRARGRERRSWSWLASLVMATGGWPRPKRAISCRSAPGFAHRPHPPTRELRAAARRPDVRLSGRGRVDRYYAAKAGPTRRC